MRFTTQLPALLLSFLTILLAACDNAAPPPAVEAMPSSGRANAVTIDYTGDVQIGNPWVMSQVTPIKQNLCLESFDDSVSAIDSNYHGQKVTDISNVQESLGVSVTASARALVASATTKMSFSKNVQTSRTNSTFIGRAHAEKTRTIKVEGTDALAQSALAPKGFGHFQVGHSSYPYAGVLGSLPQEIRLTDKAKQKLAESREAFIDYCGDGYVYSIFEGVEVYGYFSINQVSGSVATAAEAMISGGTASYQAAIDAYRKAKSETSNVKETSDFKQYGGGSMGINPTNLEEFFKVASQVRTEVGVQGKPTRVVVASYETIPECRESANCPGFESDEYNVVLRSYQINALESALQRIDDASTHTGTVYASGRTQVDLLALRNQVSQSLGALKDSTRKCLSGGSDCALPGADAVEPILEPQLKLPLAYAAYPRQNEFELTVAQYQAEVVRRTLDETKHALCQQYFNADSKYCNDVHNLSAQTLAAKVSPVVKIRTGATGNQEGGNPYQNERQIKCLDIQQAKDQSGTAVILYPCKTGGKSSRKNQIFGYNGSGNLTSWNGLCVETHKGALRVANCGRGAPNQTWLYTTSRQLRQGGYCLSDSLKLEACDASNRFTWLRKSH